jgi:serine/threonine-protein kinase
MRGEAATARLGATGLAATVRQTDTDLPETARATPSPVSLAVPARVLHDELPRYERRARLGRGGMGEVQLCLDRRIGREVAMKLVRPEVAADELVRARFEREAWVQGQLEHPSVVPVHDLGIDARERLFFTMKRVRGRTLADVIDRQREGHAPSIAAYSRRRLLGAFSQLCLGVAFAHSRGVVHRDLKPDNVMLGSFGEVHILDWGIATLLEEVRSTDERGDTGVVDAELDESHRTHEGEAVGTPGYMAPEQVLGHRVDERSDVFALGALLFEILTLHPLVPFGPAEQMHAEALRGVDARASRRFPDADVPPELEAICLRATAPPDERYPTARALHADLERYLDGDRDLAQRRALAAACLVRAEDASRRAHAGGDDAAAARAAAMKELTAAVALDPTDPRAPALLGALLLEGPTDMPAAARAAFEESRQRGRTSMRLTVFLATLGYPLTTLALGALGVRDAQLYAVLLGLSALCPIVAYWSMRLRDDTTSPMVLLVTTMITAAAFTLVAGPVVLLPSVAGGATVAFVSLGGERRRRPAIVLGLGAIVVPLLLELAGVVAPSYRFDDAGMHVLPRVTDLPAGPTLGFLALASLATIVVPVVLVLRTQRFLRELEERTFLHAWNLRSLVPDAAHLPPIVPAGQRRRVR